MAKYKLTVKYNNVCDLSIAGDLPDIIANEFDQYVKSMLYKKEEWENFEANFKLAAKKEYGNLKRAKRAEEKASADESAAKNKPADKAETAAGEESKPDKNLKEETPEKPVESKDVEEKTAKNISDSKELKALQELAESIDNADSKEIKEAKKELAADNEQKNAEEKAKRPTIVSFGEYIKDKNINTPLDEFVAGACYLDKILNVKEFSLKQLNAKLYPAFGRLASSNIISEAIDRVLIEIIKDGTHQRYKINQNAWNYHNYDLVRHGQDTI